MVDTRKGIRFKIHFVRSFHNSSLISFVQRITKRNNRNRRRETLQNLAARYKKKTRNAGSSSNQGIKVHKIDEEEEEK